MGTDASFITYWKPNMSLSREQMPLSCTLSETKYNCNGDKWLPHYTSEAEQYAIVIGTNTLLSNIRS